MPWNKHTDVSHFQNSNQKIAQALISHANSHHALLMHYCDI